VVTVLLIKVNGFHRSGLGMYFTPFLMAGNSSVLIQAGPCRRSRDA
jgi:hypothetical protein